MNIKRIPIKPGAAIAIGENTYRISGLLSNGGEHSFAPTRINEANNTVYAIVDKARGDTLDNAYSSLSRYEKSEILLLLCEAVNQLHKSNRLYLDIKPSNIWLFEKSEQSRRVALFDFDTVLPTDDDGRLQYPYPNNISVSDGWSPREQQSRQQYAEICRATDVYTFGVVIYRLYMGKSVDTSALSDINANNLAFLDASGVFDTARNALADVKNFLRNSLRHAIKSRAENLESLVASLRTLREHSQTVDEQPALSDQLDRMEGKIDEGFRHRAAAGVEGGAVFGTAVTPESTRTSGAGFSSVRGVGFKPCRQNEYYNLFVLDDEYTQGSFCIDKSRSITRDAGVKPE